MHLSGRYGIYFIFYTCHSLMSHPQGLAKLIIGSENISYILLTLYYAMAKKTILLPEAAVIHMLR